MHKLKGLKHMLVHELEGFADSGSLSKASLETIDTLAHACKNICKIIDCCKEDEVYKEELHSENLKDELKKLIESM